MGQFSNPVATHPCTNEVEVSPGSRMSGSNFTEGVDNTPLPPPSAVSGEKSPVLLGLTADLVNCKILRGLEPTIFDLQLNFDLPIAHQLTFSDQSYTRFWQVFTELWYIYKFGTTIVCMIYYEPVWDHY